MMLRRSARARLLSSTAAGAGVRVLLAKRPLANEPIAMEHLYVRQGGCLPLAPVCAAGSLGSASASDLYCRTLMVSVDPFLRCRFNESTGVEYTAPYEVDGSPLSSAGIGVVLACGVDAAHQGFAAGDLVLQPFDAWPWATAASIPASSVSRIPPALGALVKPSALLGAAGQPGVTAFLGVDRVARPQPGDTVIVSGAAGAVGSIAAQLFRKRGARVVGLCGSEDKGRWLVDAGLVDRFINYKQPEAAMAAELEQERASIYWDNAGGATSDRVILHSLEPRARIIVCGQIDMYNDSDAPYPPPLTGQALAHATEHGMSRARYLVLDHEAHFGHALSELIRLVAAGELVCRETVWHGGVGSAPRAFIEMMAGANAGKALVAADPDARHPLAWRWRAAEWLREALPPALRGFLASRFVTEARMAKVLGGAGGG